MLKVFVYGSLRKGLSNDINNMAERLGAEITFKGVDTIEAEMYSMVWFPAIVFDDTSESSVQVVGEVYEISSNCEDMLAVLDALEGYPAFYNRKEIDTELGKAWVYYHEKPHHAGLLINMGDWKEYLNFEEQTYDG